MLTRAVVVLAVAVFGLLVSNSSVAEGGNRLDPQSIAGVYKVRFANALVGGETFKSEDILEIVPVAADAAYFRTHLEFYNGHICAINGIGHVQGAQLVYHQELDHSSFPTGTTECILRIGQIGPNIRLDDNNSCKDYCGMRGSFMGVTFPAASRKPIRYMARLKASKEYKAAIALDRQP